MHKFLNVYNLSDMLVPAGNNAVHMDKEPLFNTPLPRLRAQGISSISIVPPALNFGLPFYVPGIEFEGI